MDWDIDIWRRVKYAVVVAVLTFGLTAATAVAIPPSAAGPGFPGALIPLIAVVGWFVVTPLILLLGVPFGGDEAETDDRDPLERLRDRYAAGEISEAEFDRKVERLLETDVDRTPGASEVSSLDEFGPTDGSTVAHGTTAETAVEDEGQSRETEVETE